MTLEELFEKLKNLTYESAGYSGTTFHFKVIEIKEFHQVELLIRKYLSEKHDAEVNELKAKLDEMGELKAKVYAYEAIIANSNFAPVLQAKTHNEVENGSEVADANDTQTDE